MRPHTLTREDSHCWGALAQLKRPVRVARGQGKKPVNVVKVKCLEEWRKS